MKKFFFLICSCQSFLVAGVTQPLTLSIGSGYQKEKSCEQFLTNTAEQTRVFQEKQTFSIGKSTFSVRALERDFFVRLNGSYGQIFQGHGTRWIGKIPQVSFEPFYSFHAKGFVWDAFGVLGYGVNLIPEHATSVILIPMIGYGGFGKKVKKKHFSEKIFIQGNTSIETGVCEKEDTETVRGPGLGLHFLLDVFSPKFWLFGEYLFSSGDFCQHSFVQFEVKNFSQELLISDILYSRKEKISSGRGFGHEGTLGFWIDLSKAWKIKISSQGFYFFSRKWSHLRKEEKVFDFFLSTESVSKSKDKWKEKWMWWNAFAELVYQF